MDYKTNREWQLFHEEIDLCKKLHKSLCDYHTDFLAETVEGVMLTEGFFIYRMR